MFTWRVCTAPRHSLPYSHRLFGPLPPSYPQVYCESLSDTDVQYFAVVANGEFIATNDPPEPPEPSDWNDWLDRAKSIEITWQTGLIVLLGVMACCAASCACRRCHHEQQKAARLRKERSVIAGAIAGRHEKYYNGRKFLPLSPRQGSFRPKPVPGPVRQPSTRGEAGRFVMPSDPIRKHDRTSSMRSVFSDRSSVLTGAGAAVPISNDPNEFPAPQDFTASSMPSQQACPECGLLLADAAQLASHLEAQHGGRFTRKQDTAAAMEAARARADRMAKQAGTAAPRRPPKGNTRSSEKQTRPKTTVTASGRPSSNRKSDADAVDTFEEWEGTAGGRKESEEPVEAAARSRIIAPVVVTTVRKKSSQPSAAESDTTGVADFSGARGRNGRSADASNRSGESSSSNARSSNSNARSNARPISSGKRYAVGPALHKKDAAAALRMERSGGDGSIRRVRSTPYSSIPDKNGERGRGANPRNGRGRSGSPVRRGGRGVDDKYGRTDAHELSSVSDVHGKREPARHSSATRAAAAAATTGGAVVADAATMGINGQRGHEGKPSGSAVTKSVTAGAEAPSHTTEDPNQDRSRKASKSRGRDGRDGRNPQRTARAAADSAIAALSSAAPASKLPKDTESEGPEGGRPTTRLKDLRPDGASTSPENSGHSKTSRSSDGRKGNGTVRPTSSAARQTREQEPKTRGRPASDQQQNGRSSRPMVLAPMPRVDDATPIRAPRHAGRPPTGLRAGESGSRSGAPRHAHQRQHSRGRSHGRRLSRSNSLDSDHSRASSLDRKSSFRRVGSVKSKFGLDDEPSPTKEDFGNEPRFLYPGIRRLRSSDDQVPIAERLTADMLRRLGPTGTAYAVPAPAFSPVTPALEVFFGARPAYSPMDRARAEERSALEQPKKSKARKFFRQVSG